MRIYLLDNDQASWVQTSQMLSHYSDVELVGSSYESDFALDDVLVLKPDALFVETRLGSLSGFAASQRIRQYLPDLRVVYVTTSRAYALQAFEQQAFDYLLKPLTGERLEQTIVRLRRVCGCDIHTKATTNKME
ncbi:LytTR family DNA-binding domain-containing protein [Saccharibacillus sp. JS10]|uniref:LytR/AlgR family response regulator transcription factor n=1 Tax=Saccharibacillus sp. JS10 TaxID=2950552 RepID=UPI00210A5489|nr:response regulator [Saccharibacillus sp. JS10]MCQ4087995.1 response regulator [Saccharibacillus sp. JS10]